MEVMRIKNVYINIINNHKESKQFIEENHYSHKMPQAVKYKFGFYYKYQLRGMAIFSVPANRYSITSVFEDEHQSIGIELSRLFTTDNNVSNFESYCLSKCLQYLKDNTDYDVVVSYADPNFGHVGYLYQAVNGLYLGQTSKETRYFYKNQLLTRRSLGRKCGDTEVEHAKRIMEDGAEKVKMDGKHKYLFFITNKKRKRDLIKKMKVSPQKYPKLQESITSAIK